MSTFWQNVCHQFGYPSPVDGEKLLLGEKLLREAESTPKGNCFLFSRWLSRAEVDAFKQAWASRYGSWP